MTDTTPGSPELTRHSPFSLRNKIGRVVWGCVWFFLFRPSPKIAYGWRRMLLRLFGAKMGPGSAILPTSRIWAPWNLQMGAHSCIGDYVDCYSAAPLILGPWALVSQYSLLCTASHDYEIGNFPGFQKPIIIGAFAWVAADVYVGPGVTIGEGAVVGARSSVYKNVQEWTVVGGNPARFIRNRKWRPSL